MSSTRFLRPFARLAARRNVAPFTPSVCSGLQEFGKIRQDATLQTAGARGNSLNLTNGQVALMAGMPQLVPFYFMNEIFFLYLGFPVLVYFFTKYELPKEVRTRAARLFISKL